MMFNSEVFLISCKPTTKMYLTSSLLVLEKKNHLDYNMTICNSLVHGLPFLIHLFFFLI